MFKNTKILLPALAMLNIAMLAPAYADNAKPATVSVTGTGSLSVQPDMAEISFGVLREGKTAREALDANSEAMAAILKSLRLSGIEDKDIQTSQFNIQPRYFYPKNNTDGSQQQPRIVGYTVSNTITLRVREIGQTGKILDEVVTLGVNSGGNISFTNSDIEGILMKAREKAVKNAAEKAETLAKAAGVELGKILKISEGEAHPRPQEPMHGRAMSLEAASSNVPLASGEATYKVNVSVEWEIDQ